MQRFTIRPSSLLVRIALLVASLLVAYWIFCALSLGQESQIPPDVLMVNDLSCKIEQHEKLWAATCTANYLNHGNSQHKPWVVMFPARKSEPAANKDVDKWCREVRRIQAVTKPVDVRELAKERK